MSNTSETREKILAILDKHPELTLPVLAKIKELISQRKERLGK